MPGIYYARSNRDVTQTALCQNSQQPRQRNLRRFTALTFDLPHGLQAQADGTMKAGTIHASRHAERFDGNLGNVTPTASGKEILVRRSIFTLAMGPRSTQAAGASLGTEKTVARTAAYDHQDASWPSALMISSLPAKHHLPPNHGAGTQTRQTIMERRF